MDLPNLTDSAFDFGFLNVDLLEKGWKATFHTNVNFYIKGQNQKTTDL